MNGNYYTGHVGDSRIVLGRQDLNSDKWIACPMTRDHKPESPREKKRIEAAGGQVINKSGIGRVVWNRPKPCLNPAAAANSSNTQAYDAIPFLAVSRALGDLWSLNKSLDIFIVSPEPDVHCIPVNCADRCLVLASDGLWNMMNNQTAIKVVQDFEDSHKPYCLPTIGSIQVSHASQLLDVCMNRWSRSRYRADNTTVLTIMFDNEMNDDDDDEDLSDTGSESLSQTESDEENDPVAQNRIPISNLNPYYLSTNYCPSFYDILNDLYDSGVDPEIDDDDLFSEKSSFNFIGETIYEMNSKKGKCSFWKLLKFLAIIFYNYLGIIEKTLESEVSSVLAQLIGQVASQIEDVSPIDSSSPSESNTSLTCTLSPHFSNDLSSQLEKFNELTDDQLLDIRITECHTTILNWVNPNPYKRMKTK